jgi:hypothetical protein
LPGAAARGYRLAVSARLMLVVVALAGVGAATMSAAVPSDPEAQLAAIRKAALAQKSVHYEQTGRDEHSHWVVVADVGTTKGIQRLTIFASTGIQRLTFVVADGAVFVRGNADGLNRNLSFRSAASKRWAGKWIRIPRSDRAWYDRVADGVTLPSIVATLDVQPLFRNANVTKWRGQPAFGVAGEGLQGGRAVLYAAATGQPLSIELVEDDPDRAFHQSTRFSHWNEQLHVHTPHDAVPFARTGLE